MPEHVLTPPDTSLYEQLAAGTAPPIAAEPVSLVIFGGAGDLAHRKLLPALYNLHLDGLLPPRVAITGVGRKSMTDDDYRQFAKTGVESFSRRPIDSHAWPTFAASLFWASASLDDSLASLGARLDVVEHERGLPGDRLYYLAVPPALFVPTVKQLDRARFIVKGTARPSARIVVEKPIGHDLASARTINDAIAQVFDERQIYRIDHYLGKETVQNILVLRFANSIFEPLFNQKYIDHIQVTVAEAEGVGNRAGYYESAGALRDMVQNHLLQLLCLVAMEPPRSLDADVIRDEKLEVLQSLRPLHDEGVDASTVRGRYDAGFVMGQPVPGYREESGVDTGSRT
jgi:glucose-6-phosphate 1-dehydrogenase